MPHPIPDTSPPELLRPSMRRRSDCIVDWQLPDDPDEAGRPDRRVADTRPSVPPHERGDADVGTEAPATGAGT